MGHFTPFEAPDRVKLVFTESIVGELPALDAVAVSKGGMWSHVRTFFVGSREIGLIVTAPEDRKDAPELGPLGPPALHCCGRDPEDHDAAVKLP